jgi:pyrroline-5-carboxylate reductase
MIVYAPNACVTEEQETAFLRILKRAGRLDRLAEEKIDAATAIMGCGPAFAYLFTEALADGGVLCGLPRDKAIVYAAQMMRGAAEMVLQKGQHPGKLKDDVCSPGGSTIEGVRALEEGGFRATAMNAVIAAYEKNKKLG